MQVMGGLIGAIYVKPAPSSVSSSAALTSLSVLRRFLLLAQHISMSSNNNSTDPFRVSPYTELASISNIPINPVYVDSSVQDVYLINGQFQPKLAFATNEEIIIDLVNASGDTTLEIDIREQVIYLNSRLNPLILVPNLFNRFKEILLLANVQ